ncbi:acetyl-CoA carboxylase biotin carboxylase subunit family protein [Nocardia sp. XZ_19_385]|uniref:ATP-grasp domain-containing protein n=1 Tax=Nocardia sp. XZ_19_385 TaxID=2769488 RepID=UPI00188EE03A|nr:ATP-grasp domain-containing protein [Nocardia sp. XZ_19_385]
MPTSESGAILVAHRLPAHVTPLREWLSDVAEQVVLITSREVEQGYSGQFGGLISVSDYSSSDEVVTHLDRICSEQAVSRIVYGTEDDILRLARIRDRYGVSGLSEAAALVYRDKYRMKIAAAKGVATPEFLAPSNAADAEAFAERIGWPVVVKPRLSYGSRGVAVVHEGAELAAQLSGYAMKDLLLEEYLPGIVCHVDGFMQGGEVLLSVPSRYVNSCLSFADGVSLGSVQLDDHDPLAQGLTDFARRTVALFPETDLTPFHLEVFIHEDTQDLYFCEIAARLGGGHIYETLGLTTGVNPVELWFRDQAGLRDGGARFARGPERYGFLLVPPREGTLDEIVATPLPDSVLQHNQPDKFPRGYSAATASTDTVASFVVRGADAVAVESALHACAQWAEKALRWSA